jgi:glycine hydroxymethyltransferase
MHTIAAKAVCFHEAMSPAFRDYAAQIVLNARTLAGALAAEGCRLVSGGTDNHLMLVDLTSLNVTGRDAAQALDQAGIIVNKNAIPFDTRSPMVTSGIRIGTPAITSRGMKEKEMRLLAGLIMDVLRSPQNPDVLSQTREKADALAAAFPVRL